jgi:hypothetical protein
MGAEHDNVCALPQPLSPSCCFVLAMAGDLRIPDGYPCSRVRVDLEGDVLVY